jgi:hypothetical protein
MANEIETHPLGELLHPEVYEKEMKAGAKALAEFARKNPGAIKRLDELLGGEG